MTSNESLNKAFDAIEGARTNASVTTITRKIGKTERKRNSGAPQRNASNKEQRSAWQMTSNATNATFPKYTCNGKKNRSVKIEKKNGRIAK